MNEPSNWIYGLGALASIALMIRWLLVTVDIREELRAARAEQKERHKEIVDILKKQRPE